MSETLQSEPNSKRPWYQYSIGSLLILTFLFALTCGFISIWGPTRFLRLVILVILPFLTGYIAVGKFDTANTTTSWKARMGGILIVTVPWMTLAFARFTWSFLRNRLYLVTGSFRYFWHDYVSHPLGNWLWCGGILIGSMLVAGGLFRGFRSGLPTKQKCLVAGAFLLMVGFVFHPPSIRHGFFLLRCLFCVIPIGSLAVGPCWKYGLRAGALGMALFWSVQLGWLVNISWGKFGERGNGYQIEYVWRFLWDGDVLHSMI